MDHAPLVLSVALIWFVAVASPGPNFFAVSGLALSRSRRAAFGATLGIATGAALYAALTMFGLNLVLARFAWLTTAVRIVGGAYLVWLGVQCWRHAGAGAAVTLPSDAGRSGELLAGLRLGLATSLTNPKAIAFFLSLFAAAMVPTTPLAVKLAVLAAGVLIELSWYGVVATVLSTGPLRGGYRRVRGALDRAFGTLFVVFGLRIALDER